MATANRKCLQMRTCNRAQIHKQQRRPYTMWMPMRLSLSSRAESKVTTVSVDI